MIGMCATALLSGLTTDGVAFKAAFKEAAVGALPVGWTAAKTGAGEGSAWKVVEDSTAPNGAKALAQTAESPNAVFNVCVANDTSFADVEATASFKATAGKNDQGGGLVWRYVDADNYYIARFNPLEENFRLYKVVAGKRLQLATKEDLKAPAGQWHQLAVRMKGDRIECRLNGVKHLEARDGTFARAGKIGLWTKSDARTSFDAVEAKAAE